MLITRVSLISGKTHTREIDLKIEDYEKWRNGELIQNAMPYLSADDREFLISGITPEEWDEEKGKEEDD